jgi:hypothetical protein
MGSKARHTISGSCIHARRIGRIRCITVGSHTIFRGDNDLVKTGIGTYTEIRQDSSA